MKISKNMRRLYERDFAKIKLLFFSMNNCFLLRASIGQILDRLLLCLAAFSQNNPSFLEQILSQKRSGKAGLFHGTEEV